MHENTGTGCLTVENDPIEDDGDTLLVPVTRAAELIGISRRQMYRVLDGKVPCPKGVPPIEDVYIGSRRLVVYESLKEYVNQLVRSDARSEPDTSTTTPESGATAA